MKNATVTSLKFPAGEFTHTELAQFNGKSNQTVWARYLKARQTGQIVSAGTRKTEGSKGTPALLWKVNPHWTMAVMVINPPAPEVPQVAPVEVVAEVASAEQADLQAELEAALA